MWNLFSDSALQRLTSQSIALDVELAGAAMACQYSSSDEYEAALIAERRRAGAYDVPRGQRAVLWCALTASALVALLLAL
jgi:hypothetical protein